jgi:hypothetical protein
MWGDLSRAMSSPEPRSRSRAPLWTGPDGAIYSTMELITVLVPLVNA